jgi:hypothetical protein
MIKMILQTLLGFLISSSGLYSGILYLMESKKLSSIWMLFISLLLIGGGAYLLLLASKSNKSLLVNMNLDQSKNEDNELKNQEPGLLEKNNELLQKWAKTMENRDKMKLLEFADNVKNEKVS